MAVCKGKREVAKGIVADMVEDLCDENLVQLDLVSDDDVDEAEPVSYTHLTLPTICSV